MKNNNYESYKKTATMEEFFKRWDKKSLDALTDKLKDHIYKKYLLKCAVFRRDNFKCQKMDCKSRDSPLTIHHVKAKRNGGADKERNCVTLCRTCHQGYERAKIELKFDKNAMNLPSRIRGQTFKRYKEEKTDWKKITSEMRKLRKELKAKGLKTTIDWDLVFLLMRWLTVPFDEWDD